jgi:alkylation response protein AidB-like acyl-CoA dehydrogenase
MSAIPLGSPLIPIILPTAFTKAESDTLRAANPAAIFVLVTPAATVAQTPPVDLHKDAVNSWLDVIDGIITYAGGAAASIIVSPALAPIVVGLLHMGTAEARQLLLKAPATERWTLAMLMAEPAAARPLP